jgi:hypothetical protein
MLALKKPPFICSILPDDDLCLKDKEIWPVLKSSTNNNLENLYDLLYNALVRHAKLSAIEHVTSIYQCAFDDESRKHLCIWLDKLNKEYSCGDCAYCCKSNNKNIMAATKYVANLFGVYKSKYSSIKQTYLPVQQYIVDILILELFDAFDLIHKNKTHGHIIFIVAEYLSFFKNTDDIIKICNCCGTISTIINLNCERIGCQNFNNELSSIKYQYDEYHRYKLINNNSCCCCDSD